MSLTVIIPVKNEEEIIENTLIQIGKSWIKLIDHEIIIVNDFCNDDTINKVHSKNLNLKIVNNTNAGLGYAIINGINNSSKEFIAIFMADLSDSLEDLEKYYKIMINDKKIDAVFGSRFIKNSKVINYPKIKYLINRMANNFIKLFFLTKYNDFTNAFKIYKKSTLLKLFPIVSENFNVFLELPLKIISRKYNYKIIPITWNGRKKGVTKFNLQEIGSKYIFTFLYCFFEKILLKKKN
jgi:dolichol-phosphate mannosyltransferase